MNKTVGYIGPDEVWRRFMAGLPVTPRNLIEDSSEWVIRPMPRYHRDRLRVILESAVGQILGWPE